MRFIDLTLDQPAENLALDEALLEEAESAGQPQETLRLWESPSHVAVVGRSSSVGEEIDLAQSPVPWHSRAAALQWRGQRTDRSWLPDVLARLELRAKAGVKDRGASPPVGTGANRAAPCGPVGPRKSAGRESAT